MIDRVSLRFLNVSDGPSLHATCRLNSLVPWGRCLWRLCVVSLFGSLPSSPFSAGVITSLAAGVVVGTIHSRGCRTGDNTLGRLVGRAGLSSTPAARSSVSGHPWVWSGHLGQFASMLVGVWFSDRRRSRRGDESGLGNRHSLDHGRGRDPGFDARAECDVAAVAASLCQSSLERTAEFHRGNCW